MNQTLMGKKVVIVGGSSGIGLATAKVAAEKGSEVLIAGRSADKLDRAVTEIGSACSAKQLDVTDEEAVKAFFEDIESIDHLITSASGSVLGAFLEMETSDARALVESKLWGQYYLAKYAAPKLSSDASITFFSGIVSQRPMAGASTYAIIAGAMESLTRSLALELAPVRVNCITPGVIDTPVWSELLPDDIKAQQFSSIASALPVKRVGTPEDVSKAVLYVMENEFATGSIINVDGGYCVS